MIIGIGTDLVDITRMTDNIVEHGDKLAQKILSDVEFLEYKSSTSKGQFLASRFAAKEAFAKALGTGFRDGLSLKHITVGRLSSGQPTITPSDQAQILVDALKVSRIHLTLSHERELTMAFVVLEA